MNNNCKSAKVGMQRSKDDMLGISIESTTIFIQSLRVFAQSSELWAQLAKKLVQSLDVFSQSSRNWAHSIESVQGEQNGVSINNVGSL